MIRFNTPGDINALRRMMMAGDVPEDTIDTMEQTGGMVAVTPPKAQAAQRMRVVGADGSAAHDLGFSDAPIPAVDYGRAPIQIAGVGKGWYAKDGRSAIVTGPGGEKVQVLLGYDKAASDRATDAQIKREAARANIDATREQIEASRSLRNIRETKAGQGPGGVPVYDPGNLGNIWNTGAGGQGGPMVPQALLEKMHGRAPEGMRWSPSGQLEEIPGFQKPMTESQAKALGFGTRAAEATAILETVGQEGKVQPYLLKRAVENVPLIGGALAMGANFLASGEQQQVEQAERNFINAVLRRESGAVISPQEFANARLQYFPQPDDSPRLIEQKRRNRQAVVNSLAEEVGGRRRLIDAAGASGREFGGGMGGSSAPPEAVEYLRRNPSLSAAFDMKYGKGAAAAALGGR